MKVRPIYLRIYREKDSNINGPNINRPSAFTIGSVTILRVSENLPYPIDPLLRLGLRRQRGDGGACDGVRAGDITGGGASGGLPPGEGRAIPDRAGGHVQGRAQVAFLPQAPALRPGSRLQGPPHHCLWYLTSISHFFIYYCCISTSMLAFL